MKTIEIGTTITRCKRFGSGLASKRVDIFEVDCVAIVEYEFDGPQLDWNVMAFRFEDWRGDFGFDKVRLNAHETLDRSDVFFAALEAALDREFIEDRIFEEDNEYAAACLAEDESERTDYRRTAL